MLLLNDGVQLTKILSTHVLFIMLSLPLFTTVYFNGTLVIVNTVSVEFAGNCTADTIKSLATAMVTLIAAAALRLLAILVSLNALS